MRPRCCRARPRVRIEIAVVEHQLTVGAIGVDLVYLLSGTPGSEEASTMLPFGIHFGSASTAPSVG